MLHIHRADRADALAAALGGLLASPLEDPFEAEVIAVHTRGVERWLTQTLSTQLGIVANVRFPSPREIVDETVGAACGIDPEIDPWAQGRVLWPLLDLVDEHLDEPWLQMLASHLRDSAGASDPRRLPAVRHLAWLFDRYALERPAMLRAWQRNEEDLPEHLAWQATLWRTLRQRVGLPSPAERLPDAAARLRADPTLAALPKRLALFGLTRLPPGHAELFAALAEHRDVHVFVLHPSPALWDRGAQDPLNRLLASWGRDVRELQLVLPTGVDHLHDPERPAPQTLLQRLQHDVRTDHRALGSGPPLDDQSIEVHSCHGRARQVEVLRDAILHALQQDTTLEPRDVIVMCPDIETFAPLIHATFGAADIVETDAVPDLRVRLADRALRQTNPVLGAIGRLLDLAGERLTASQVLDFADREPVRRCFELDDDDLVRLKDWIARAEIRWGLDAAHRAPFKVDVDANTWRHGLDRVLVGVAMTEDEQRLVGGALPLDDVGSGDIDLAGRFAELIDRLADVVGRFATPHTMAGWAAELTRAADLLTDTREPWQRSLDRLLQRFARDASGTATLDLAEVRGLLAENLRGRPTRANFRTGHLTFCTLNPMRTVPHRVICLLGLDDGVFPRVAPRDGDDLIVADRRLGDRDGRSEDRQMLLDALMAAQDKLIVTYTGNDERTNAPKPPAVPVGELLDVIGRTVDGFEVTRHPLQPFDRRNFAASAPRSFDEVALGGAQALSAPRTSRPPFLTDLLPALDDRVVELVDLERFVAHPARAFLRRRLGVSLADYTQELKDDLPIGLDGLESWQVGERLLDAILAGIGEEQAVAAERARGTLPPGKLGEQKLDEVLAQVRAVAEAAKDVQPNRTSLDVRAALPGDRLLSGTVAGLAGDVLQTVSFSRVSPRQRLTAWVRLLALTVAHEREFEALTIGRRRTGASPRFTTTIVRIAPQPDARAHLEQLVALFDEAMREPPPLACKSSAAFAAAARAGRDPHGAARKEWTSEYRFDKEDRELEHRLLLGGVVAFEDLDPRFADWSLRLWTPLLEAEDINEL